MTMSRCLVSFLLAVLVTACTTSAPTPTPAPHALVTFPVEDFGARRYYRIQFEPGSATLTKESHWKVEKAIGMIVKIQMKSFELWGHGDPGQPRSAADRLARRRMAAVATLIREGVSPKPLIRLHAPTEPTPPDGIEDDRSPVESSVEIYCSNGASPLDGDSEPLPQARYQGGGTAAP